MAPQNAARPATAQTVDAPQVSTFGGIDNPPNSKASPAQAEKRNPAAVREATIASILDQANFVLGGVRLNAEIAQQFAGAGDQRGFLYALDQTVRHAIRAGAEGVELRKIRAKMREAPPPTRGGRHDQLRRDQSAR